MPGDTSHLKSGRCCFLAKRSALKGQSMKKFASCYKWRWNVLGNPSPGSLKDSTSLKDIGLCGPLSGCELYHHVAPHHIMRCHLVGTSATWPNKVCNMACHNGPNVAMWIMIIIIIVTYYVYTHSLTLLCLTVLKHVLGARWEYGQHYCIWEFIFLPG